ncbi:MAG: dihydroorotase [archaeon]
MHDLVILNAKVMRPKGLDGVNIGIDGGKITAFAKSKIRAERTIDATSFIVLPGLIDIHAHFRDPGETKKEDFFTGTCAAAHSGVTTVFDMPNNDPPIKSMSDLRRKDKIVSGKAVIDYALYLGAKNPYEVKESPLTKFYTGGSQQLSVSEREFESCYAEAKHAVVHAEDSQVVEANRAKIKNPTIKDQCRIQDAESAVKGIEFVGRMYRTHQRQTHVTHISTPAEISALLPGISCDMTPHHLLLSRDDAVNNFYKVDPPLRPKEDQKKLWQELEARVTMLSTDHAPHLKSEKEKDFEEAPSGLPELDTYLPLMLTKVNQGLLSLTTFVKMASSNPAAIFGLESKGAIDIGKDADFAIINLKEEGAIRSDSLFTKCGWTPYEGWKTIGSLKTTIVRGEIVFDNGEVTKKKWGKNLLLSSRSTQQTE